MSQRTALYDQHLAMQGKMVDFGGWDMPIHYGSQIQEHQAVRTKVGMFDVSHMTIVDISDNQALAYLQRLLANDVAKLKTPGKALYSAMLNPQGGVIDDLIVYRTETGFRTVVNCATREKDLAWMTEQTATFDVTLSERPELAMIAVQGPDAINTVCSIKSDLAELIQGLNIFQGLPHNDWFFARTGYTGEDGLEIMLPAEQAAEFWQQLGNAGVAPCGLGARDTLRLEAGMNLYGNDMDETISPWQAGMGWTLALKDTRDFIGRATLEQEQNDGIAYQQVGLILQQRGVMRAGQKVVMPSGAEGVITSGTFSPTMQQSIAIARVPITDADQSNSANSCEVEMRGKLMPAFITQLPFVRNGKVLVEANLDN